MEDEPTPIPLAEASFHDSTWSTRALAIGIVTPITLGLIAWVATTQDAITLAVIASFTTFPFMLIYPFLTRTQPNAERLRLPSIRDFLIEAIAAIPYIVLVFITVSILNAALTNLLPGATPSSQRFENMEYAINDISVYAFLFAAITLAPLVEEIFFRGFLFNAFRARMPYGIAIALQAITFGVVHPFGWIYVIVVTFLGLALAHIYRTRKTLLAPMFVHGGYNAIFAIAMFAAIQANADAPAIGFYPDPDQEACVILDLTPSSPAEKAGLQPSDTIVAVDDHAIETFEDILGALAEYEPGDTVQLTIKRDGTNEFLDVTLVSRKDLAPPE